ncbi:MAG: hypothetical protein ABJO36_05210 [Litorimonas sp.]
MTLRFTLMALLGLCVVACQSTTDSVPETSVSDYAPIYFAGLVATPLERLQCEAVGGVVRSAGLAGGDNCIQTLSDGGKICRDSDDCLSECIVVGDIEFGTETTGQCRPTDNPFGCAARVENGRAEPILCVD